MLSNVDLEMEFWAETVNLERYLVNWSPHQALDGKNPKEIL